MRAGLLSTEFSIPVSSFYSRFLIWNLQLESCLQQPLCWYWLLCNLLLVLFCTIPRNPLTTPLSTFFSFQPSPLANGSVPANLSTIWAYLRVKRLLPLWGISDTFYLSLLVSCFYFYLDFMLNFLLCSVIEKWQKHLWLGFRCTMFHHHDPKSYLPPTHDFASMKAFLSHF